MIFCIKQGEASGGGSGDSGLDALAAALTERGYDPVTPAELPGRGTDQAAVATAASLAGFAVMLDRDPSRRPAAYDTARAAGDVIVRLVPAGRTDAEQGAEETVRAVPFEGEPVGALDEAIARAESVRERR